MERLRVYCRDSCRGEATIQSYGGRAEIAVRMEDPGDGLYRAALLGERGEMVLGVLEPCKGTLILRRRPYWRDVERLGTLESVRAECSFTFPRKRTWQRSGEPAELVSRTFLKERLAGIPCAWWRRDEGKLILALPLDEGKGFPLEALFCFGRIACVEGRQCVVYTLDREENPV